MYAFLKGNKKLTLHPMKEEATSTYKDSKVKVYLQQVNLKMVLKKQKLLI